MGLDGPLVGLVGRRADVRAADPGRCPPPAVVGRAAGSVGGDCLGGEGDAFAVLRLAPAVEGRLGGLRGGGFGRSFAWRPIATSDM